MIVLVLLALLEAGSFAFVRMRDEWFSHRDVILARLSAEEGRYDEFLERAYNPIYGWDRPLGEQRTASDCLGREVPVTVNADRSRIMPTVADVAEILLVGDSFTAGAEVADDETFAWRLATMLDRPVRNHGVGGFGPVQAGLTFEAIADRYPNLELVVLGSMHESAQRMSARPQFWLRIREDQTSHYYTDKAIADELVALVERFVAAAESRGIEPVLLFLPQKRSDRFAPEPVISELEHRFGDRLTIVAFGRVEFDWTSYLIGDDDCHPSPAGHEMIPRTLAPVLRPMLEEAASSPQR